MDIKKFEAYTYKGKGLDTINRKEFLDTLRDIFTESMFGYNNNGTYYDPELEELRIYLFNDETKEEKTIKLDFSDMGIEIGHPIWSEDDEEEEQFIPERNLDDDITQEYKKQKKDTNKFNV